MHNLEKLYDSIFDINFLIKYGYFDVTPKEKQDEFNSNANTYGQSDSFYIRIFNFENLAKYLTANYEIIKENYFTSGYENCTEPINFTIPKSKYARRQYKLPNIYSYIDLAIYMIENKHEFISIFLDNKHSMSKFFNLFEYNFNFTQEMNKTLLQGGDNVLNIDLSNFYHSLYTHSIPWVIMGKENAKAKKKGGFANQLDKLITKCQNDETHGIPTGNMLSRIITELYMCYIDKEMEYSGYIYSRYVDDIIYSYTIEDSREKFIRDFNNICIRYELKVNDSKTKINRFPYENLNNKYNISNYFNRLTKNSEVKTWIKEIRNFIDLCISEESKGNKGSIKFMFPAIINTLKNKKINSKKIKEIFQYTNEISEFNLIEYLIDISLKDSKLTNRFLTFVNELKTIVKQEKFINKIFQKYFSKNKELIRKDIAYYNSNHFHQELYQYLIYIIEFRVKKILTKKISINLINNNTDDFSLILVTIHYLNNKWKINDLLKVINKLFEDSVVSYSSDTIRMSKNLWFYRYFIYYLQNNCIFLKKAINKFCLENNFEQSKGYGFRCELNWRYILNVSPSK